MSFIILLGLIKRVVPSLQSTQVCHLKKSADMIELMDDNRFRPVSSTILCSRHVSYQILVSIFHRFETLKFEFVAISLDLLIDLLVVIISMSFKEKYAKNYLKFDNLKMNCQVRVITIVFY